MKVEIVAKRISEKTNCPEIYAVILGEVNKSYLPNTCLIWTGKRRKQKPIIKKQRDWNMVPFMAPGVQPPRAVMRYKTRDVYVHRFLIDTIDKPSGAFVTTSACGTPFCVNPLHWLVSPAPGVTFMPDDAPSDSTHDKLHQEENVSFDEDQWPEDEIEQLVDRFMCFAAGPIDPTHALLIDIPIEQLKKVVEKIGLERLLGDL